MVGLLQAERERAEGAALPASDAAHAAAAGLRPLEADGLDEELEGEKAAQDCKKKGKKKKARGRWPR